MFQKKEKQTSENLRSFQNLLRKHEEQLSKIQNLQTNEHLKSIFEEMNRIFSLKKLGSYQDYINSIEKLLACYITFVGHSIRTSSHVSSNEKGTNIDNLIKNADKIVQVEIKTGHNDDDKSVVAPLLHSAKVINTPFYERRPKISKGKSVQLHLLCFAS